MADQEVWALYLYWLLFSHTFHWDDAEVGPVGCCTASDFGPQWRKRKLKKWQLLPGHCQLTWVVFSTQGNISSFYPGQQTNQSSALVEVSICFPQHFAIQTCLKRYSRTKAVNDSDQKTEGNKREQWIIVSQLSHCIIVQYKKSGNDAFCTSSLSFSFWVCFILISPIFFSISNTKNIN